MTRLSDTQLVILGATAERPDRSVLPLTVNLTGGARAKVLASLTNKGLIEPAGEPRDEGEPTPLRITRAGLEAIGIEPEDEADAAPAPESPAKPDTGVTAADAGDAAGKTPAPASAPDGAATPAEGEAADSKPAGRPTPRAGTKQATMVEMLRRPEGATVEQIAEVTGWQKHTIRGAISGALKKKLGLTVEAARGAKGSSTVYRITG